MIPQPPLCKGQREHLNRKTIVTFTKESNVLISKELTEEINKQIGREFGASLQYYNIAAYFDTDDLPQLASFFYRQAEEERRMP